MPLEYERLAQPAFGDPSCAIVYAERTVSDAAAGERIATIRSATFLRGDDNPLHVDPQAAAHVGYPHPILHGLCTFGVVCHALVRALCGHDPARMRGLGALCSAPVFPGETIRTEIWSDGSFQARVVERDVVAVSHGRADVTP